MWRMLRNASDLNPYSTVEKSTRIWEGWQLAPVSPILYLNIMQWSRNYVEKPNPLKKRHVFYCNIHTLQKKTAKNLLCNLNSFSSFGTSANIHRPLPLWGNKTRFQNNWPILWFSDCYASLGNINASIIYCVCSLVSLHTVQACSDLLIHCLIRKVQKTKNTKFTASMFNVQCRILTFY